MNTGLFDDDDDKPRPPAQLDLSRFAIDWDKWDREMVQRLLKEVREFNANREKLVDNQAGKVGYDVWQDLFLSMHKVRPKLLDPKEVRATHQVNGMVMDEAMKLKEHEELRIWTHNDEVGSALACITMEPDMEILYDKVKEAQKAANELQDAQDALQEAQDELRDIDQMYSDWMDDGGDPDDGGEGGDTATDYEEMREQMEGIIADHMQEVKGAGKALDAELDSARQATSSALQDGLQKAVEEARDMAEAGNMWGTEAGALTRLDAEQRLRLAKKMNTPKFKRIASLFGPMERFAFDQQKRKVDYLREEIYDIEIGDDLTRVLPEKLVQMADDEEEDFFWADFAEGKLPEFKMRGQENVSKGGIIYCHDGSLSMSGDQEIWAKAVGLCLLHIARKNRPKPREFVALQFGSAHELRMDDFRNTDTIDPDLVIDFAEFFFNGGTNFETPLRKALELLEEEHARTGAIKSDIVFATDGIAPIHTEFMETLKKAQERLDFKVWGINIGGDKDAEPLFTLCDGRVCSIRDLASGGDVRDIFGGI